MVGYRFANYISGSILILFLFSGNYCAAQQQGVSAGNNDLTTRVTGTITDAKTGKPLSNVSIAFKGSNKGTSSNAEGKFVLSENGTYSHISISCIGFESVTMAIRQGEPNIINIRLQQTENQLQEVTVLSHKKSPYHNKGNPAVALIQRVIDHKDQNQMENADYVQYDQFERLSFSLFNLSPQFINSRFFRKYKFMLDTTKLISGEHQTTLPVFFSEKNYQYFYRKIPEKHINILQDQKEVNIIKFIDTVGLDIYLKRLYGNNINIYNNNIFIINHEFLSPIANHAPDFYKFFITDTLQYGNEKLVALSFTPRNKGDLLFEGKILIALDSSYAVKSCELNVNKHININFMHSLSVQQDYAKHADGRLYLEKSNVRADFGFSKENGTGVFGERTVFYKNYRLNDARPSPFYEGKSEQVAVQSRRVDTSRNNHFSNTLPPDEGNVYAKVMRLQAMPSFKRATWFASTITGGYADAGAVQIGPYDSFFSFNSIEGSRYRIGGRTTPLMSRNIYLEGYGAYGEEDERFKYYMATSFSFNHLPYYQYPSNYLKVSYQFDTDVPGQNFLIEKAQSILLSIRRGSNDFWLYNRTFKINYIKDFENHISIDAGFKHWQQRPAGSLNFLVNGSPFSRVQQLTTSQFSLGLRYAPHEQIFQGATYRHTIPGKYPIFSLQLSQSLNGAQNSSYTFTNISSNIYKRFYLSQLGFTDVTLEGGLLLGKVPFPLLNILPANQTYLYDNNAYNMMNFLEFVSDHYAGLNVTHSFSGFILNKIPLIEHLKLREYLSFKILYGGLRNENNPAFSAGLYKFPSPSGRSQTYALGSVPYTELGVGIGNIFKLMRVDLIRRLTYLDHPGVTPYGLRFSFSPQF